MITLARDPLLAQRRPDRLHARRLPAGAARRSAAACAATGDASARRPPARPEPPAVSLIVAAYDEEEVIAAKVANALALDYPRERLQLIVASDGSADAHRRARPRRRRRPRPRPAAAAARSRPRTPPPSGPSGEILAFSDANSAWAPDALARLVEPFADPDGRLRLRPGPLHRRRGRQPGGRLLALRDGGARDGVRRSAGSPPATARIYAVRRDAYLPLAAVRQPRPLASPSSSPSAACARSTSPRRGAEERMVPTIEGEFARKRRMMVGLWDIVVGDGMLSPRGYPPLYAFEIASHRLLRYLSPAAPPRRPRRQPRPARRAAGSTPSPSPLQLALLAGGAARPLRCRSRRCGSPATTCYAPPRSPPASGTAAAPAAPPGAGRRRRGPDDAARPRPRSIAALALLVLSPCPARRRDRDQARQPRPGHLPPAPGRQRRRGVRDAEAADDGAGLRPGRGRHRRHPRRPARHRRRPLAAPHLARRAAEPGQRAARRDGDRRPAPDDPRPGRRLHRRASAAATRSSPGSPAGPRSRAAPASPGRSGSSSTSGTSSTARSASTCGSSPAPPGSSSAARASPPTMPTGRRA